MRGPITDINQKFILPSLSFNQQDVDYIGPDFRQLVVSLTHSLTQLQPNTNLFYSLLMLEPSFEPYSFGKSIDLCDVQDRREDKATRGRHLSEAPKLLITILYFVINIIFLKQNLLCS